MTLNTCQEKAAQAFFDFLFTTDKEFSLSGPAGTGKTWLMQHLLLQTLKDAYAACKLAGLKVPNYEVVLSATTNKAAEVLAQATRMDACTIHSHMNLRVVDDYKTGVSKISKTGAWKVHSNQLIFIDEASMVDTKLYEFIRAGTDHTCKIVYLGDHCQMAPVFETLSPIYKKPKHFAFLTQPMRNAGQPALMALCTQLRDTVESLEFRPIDPVPGVIDYLSPADAQAYIDTTFQVENPKSRILCYTNARVQAYNQHIRGLRGYPDTLTKGERVISNTALAINDHVMLRVDQELLVKEILSAPYEVPVSATQFQVRMSVYDVLLSTPDGSLSFNLKVPEEPDHLKALIKHYAAQKDWVTFFALKNTFPDLRPKDASTVYKAQGSTYETVFLDLGNIATCTQTDQLARMLYVGASRATTRLLLFGTLPARLFQQAA